MHCRRQRAAAHTLQAVLRTKLHTTRIERAMQGSDDDDDFDLPSMDGIDDFWKKGPQDLDTMMQPDLHTDQFENLEEDECRQTQGYAGYGAHGHGNGSGSNSGSADVMFSREGMMRAENHTDKNNVGVN